MILGETIAVSIATVLAVEMSRRVDLRQPLETLVRAGPTAMRTLRTPDLSDDEKQEAVLGISAAMFGAVVTFVLRISMIATSGIAFACLFVLAVGLDEHAVSRFAVSGWGLALSLTVAGAYGALRTIRS